LSFNHREQDIIRTSDPSAIAKVPTKIFQRI
jgi:hypothetical protein